MLPLVVGLLLTSIASGTIVGRTGRYRWFPIVGTLLMAVGLWLLSRMDASTPWGVRALYMLVLGCGIGLSMQVLTIIVQNTAAYRDLGVATSGVTFFRTLGSSFGASIFGTVYANVLSNHLPAAYAASPGVDPTRTTTPEALHSYPPEQITADRRRLRTRAPRRLPRGRAGRPGRVRAGVVPQGGAAPRQHAGRGGRRRGRLRDARAQRPGTPPRARHRPALQQGHPRRPDRDLARGRNPARGRRWLVPGPGARARRSRRPPDAGVDRAPGAGAPGGAGTGLRRRDDSGGTSSTTTTCSPSPRPGSARSRSW